MMIQLSFSLFSFIMNMFRLYIILIQPKGNLTSYQIHI